MPRSLIRLIRVSNYRYLSHVTCHLCRFRQLDLELRCFVPCQWARSFVYAFLKHLNTFRTLVKYVNLSHTAQIFNPSRPCEISQLKYRKGLPVATTASRALGKLEDHVLTWLNQYNFPGPARATLQDIGDTILTSEFEVLPSPTSMTRH